MRCFLNIDVVWDSLFILENERFALIHDSDCYMGGLPDECSCYKLPHSVQIDVVLRYHHFNVESSDTGVVCYSSVSNDGPQSPHYINSGIGHA